MALKYWLVAAKTALWAFMALPSTTIVTSQSSSRSRRSCNRDSTFPGCCWLRNVWFSSQPSSSTSSGSSASIIILLPEEINTCFVSGKNCRLVNVKTSLSGMGSLTGSLLWLLENSITTVISYPGYQRFFSRAEGIFRVGRRPTSLAERRSAGHYKDLTETGNRARRVSGTQGSDFFDRKKKFWNDIHIQKFDTMIFLKTTSCRRNIATKWKELKQLFSWPIVPFAAPPTWRHLKIVYTKRRLWLYCTFKQQSCA